MNLQTTQYKIIYQGKNITVDVSDYLLSINYTDKAGGSADEIEIDLHDKDLLWANEWFPDKGAKISVQIIDDDTLLDCGTFTIDEFEYRSDRSSADTFHIRGMATAITKALRNKVSAAHENKTLKEIANTYAKKHNLTLIGDVSDTIRINRITQYRETDLAFLARIADKYGYEFSIRDNQLIFRSIITAVSTKHVLSLDKSECTDFAFRDGKKTVTTTLTYRNPEKNKVIKADWQDVHREDLKELRFKNPYFNLNRDIELSPEQASLKAQAEASEQEPVDDEQQADAVVISKQISSIIRERVCELSCPGNVLIVTGNQVELTGFGRFSGIYYVIESSHSLDRAGGYTTKFTANKTGVIDKAKHKPKKKKGDNTIYKEDKDLITAGNS